MSPLLIAKELPQPVPSPNSFFTNVPVPLFQTRNVQSHNTDTISTSSLLIPPSSIDQDVLATASLYTFPTPPSRSATCNRRIQKIFARLTAYCYQNHFISLPSQVLRYTFPPLSLRFEMCYLKIHTRCARHHC